MHYAFDLDGTLVDTRRAVEEAYIAAGVIPPKDFFGRPWRQWLNEQEVHDKKNRLYPAMLERFARPLPALELFHRLGGTIVTGASLVGASAALRAIGIDPNHVRMHCEQSALDKLNTLRSIGDIGILFEDSQYVADVVRRMSNWNVFVVS